MCNSPRQKLFIVNCSGTIFIDKRLNFVILYGPFFVFHTLRWTYSVLKALLKASFLLIGFIAAFCFIQSGESIYGPP